MPDWKEKLKDPELKEKILGEKKPDDVRRFDHMTDTWWKTGIIGLVTGFISGLWNAVVNTVLSPFAAIFELGRKEKEEKAEKEENKARSKENTEGHERTGEPGTREKEESEQEQESFQEKKLIDANEIEETLQTFCPGKEGYHFGDNGMIYAEGDDKVVGMRSEDLFSAQAVFRFLMKRDDVEKADTKDKDQLVLQKGYQALMAAADAGLKRGDHKKVMAEVTVTLEDGPSVLSLVRGEHGVVLFKADGKNIPQGAIPIEALRHHSLLSISGKNDHERNAVQAVLNSTRVLKIPLREDSDLSLCVKREKGDILSLKNEENNSVTVVHLNEKDTLEQVTRVIKETQFFRDYEPEAVALALCASFAPEKEWIPDTDKQKGVILKDGNIYSLIPKIHSEYFPGLYQAKKYPLARNGSISKGDLKDIVKNGKNDHATGKLLRMIKKMPDGATIQIPGENIALTKSGNSLYSYKLPAELQVIKANRDGSFHKKELPKVFLGKDKHGYLTIRERNEKIPGEPYIHDVFSLKDTKMVTTWAEPQKEVHIASSRQIDPTSLKYMAGVIQDLGYQEQIATNEHVYESTEQSVVMEPVIAEYSKEEYLEMVKEEQEKEETEPSRTEEPAIPEHDQDGQEHNEGNERKTPEPQDEELDRASKETEEEYEEEYDEEEEELG